MTHAEFYQVLRVRIAKMQDTLDAKAMEYANDIDRMHNFVEASRLTGQTRAETLLGMLVKHWVSVQDLVRKSAAELPIDPKLIDEKIGDAVNYLVILEALLLEKP